MKFKLITTIIFSLLLFSCGPSEAEIKAIEEQTLRKIELKKELESKLKEARKKLEETKEKIISTNAELEVAYSNMNEIKSFQLLRSRSEKENQIKNQSIYISKLEENVKILKNNVVFYEKLIPEIESQLLQLNL